MTYRAWQTAALAPAWLRAPTSAALLGELGDLKDRVADAFKRAAKCGLPGACPADALADHGAARMLPRYPSETDAQYRARLLAAFDTWRQAGTAAGVLASLAAAGFPGAVLKTTRDPGYPPDGNTAWWSRFFVELDLTATGGGPFGWQLVRLGDGHHLGDGHTLGSTATVDQVAFVRRVVELSRPAHAICGGIYVTLKDGSGLVTLRWAGTLKADGTPVSPP